jgi:hypothetical protein
MKPMKSQAHQSYLHPVVHGTPYHYLPFKTNTPVRYRGQIGLFDDTFGG